MKKPKDEAISGAGLPELRSFLDGVASGDIKMDITPLALEDVGIWDPREHYWGEEDEALQPWAQEIYSHGPRPSFEMEQVPDRWDPEDPDYDPILEANELSYAGEYELARERLLQLCELDIRCLDAHSHLALLEFDESAEQAMLHYEMGFRIGQLSLAGMPDPVLPWGFIDNRPFLRCMHGFGLWRTGRFDEALHIFKRMLWLNPSDNQGIRFLIHDVAERVDWEERSID